MSAVQSDTLGAVPEPYIDTVKTSPISPNPVDPEGLVREYGLTEHQGVFIFKRAADSVCKGL